jgi:DNA-binding MarR family transcriptional regulator
MDATESGRFFTTVVLTVFRLNGALVAAGDDLVGDLGLSTARWQVLGMVVGGPLTVSGIARRIGLTRQSVQRTANRLVRDGLAQTLANPDHQLAKLYQLTAHGERVMAEVGRRQRAWADRIAGGLSPRQLEASAGLLLELCARLENPLTTQETQP